ncbi:MAG: hypothetical protein LLG42_08045 [Chloroflexi bacterium]|nr:hypothetical protein [Chloroflexota bacterium]
MAKTFYTEHDIEDMVNRGTHALTLTDDTVLTDLAYEMASKLGLKLIRENEKPPSAPVRPYITQQAQTAAQTAQTAQTTVKSASDIRQRVRDAVIGRLGGDVDPKLLDTIIQRVLDNVGIQ